MASRSCPMCSEDAPEGASVCQCGYRFSTMAASGAAAAEVTAAEEGDNPGSGWTMSGWLFFVGGAIGLVVSFMMKVTVSSYTPPSIIDAGGSSDIINFGLLFNKGVGIACSLSAIAAGLFCIATGAVLTAIRARG